MAVKLLGLQENDKAIIDECNFNIAQNMDFENVICQFKKDGKLLTEADAMLIEAKIVASDYSFDNISWFLFSMKARGVITEGELRMLVEAVKQCDEEDSEVFCGDSAELVDLINSVVESLEDKHTLETIMGEFERYMDEASEDYPASRKAIQYIYERALFSLDILLQ